MLANRVLVILGTKLAEQLNLNKIGYETAIIFRSTKSS